MNSALNNVAIKRAFLLVILPAILLLGAIRGVIERLEALVDMWRHPAEWDL